MATGDLSPLHLPLTSGTIAVSDIAIDDLEIPGVPPVDLPAGLTVVAGADLPEDLVTTLNDAGLPVAPQITFLANLGASSITLEGKISLADGFPLIKTCRQGTFDDCDGHETKRPSSTSRTLCCDCSSARVARSSRSPRAGSSRFRRRTAARAVGSRRRECVRRAPRRSASRCSSTVSGTARSASPAPTCWKRRSRSRSTSALRFRSRRSACSLRSTGFRRSSTTCSTCRMPTRTPRSYGSRRTSPRRHHLRVTIGEHDQHIFLAPHPNLLIDDASLVTALFGGSIGPFTYDVGLHLSFGATIFDVPVDAVLDVDVPTLTLDGHLSVGRFVVGPLTVDGADGCTSPPVRSGCGCTAPPRSTATDPR